MILNKLSVMNYKNIRQAEVVCSGKINCFFGNNGVGKTNLLDAVYYLSFCKSHRNTNDNQLIYRGEDLCILQGMYDFDTKEEDIFCSVRTGQRKIFKRNKKEYGKLSEHIGLLPIVIVSPSDSDLISGGSEERRRFVDMIVSQHDKSFLNALIQYNKALAQRNSLLRNGNRDVTLYEVIEYQMALYGKEIHDKRKMMIESLEPIFNKYHEGICNVPEKVGLKYESQLDGDVDFAKSLKNSFEKDLIIGYSTFGTHKDDIKMTLEEQLIRKTGSQGQNKTFLIALKLAQYSFMTTKGSTKPILLLDDIFDKLDSERVEKIIGIVSSDVFGQIFITDTNRKYLDRILETIDKDYSLFKVEKGEVELMENKKN
jgi:DNA replication and repair protein RecF